MRSWRIDPHHALAGAGLCWAGFAGVAYLVATGQAAGLDAAGLQMWRAGADVAPRGPAWLLEGVRDLTALGGVLLRHLFALGAVAALLFLKLRREAVVLAGTVLGGWLLTRVLKDLIGRDRPSLVPHLTDAGGHSFPSGHSFNAAVVFIAIALAFAAMSPRRHVRWAIIGSSIVLTWAIAYSRVWLGVHYPSDVIAGWLGGAGWVFLAAAGLDRPAKVAVRVQGDHDEDHDR